MRQAASVNMPPVNVRGVGGNTQLFPSFAFGMVREPEAFLSRG